LLLLKKVMDKNDVTGAYWKPDQNDVTRAVFFLMLLHTISNLIHSMKFHVSVRKRTDICFPMKITCFRNINWICSITIIEKKFVMQRTCYVTSFVCLLCICSHLKFTGSVPFFVGRGSTLEFAYSMHCSYQLN
jgi:hypothetical protein